MTQYQKYFEFFAALSGFIGVSMGALAAHKAQDAYAAELLQKVSLYLLLHSIAILILSQRHTKAARIACMFFSVGIIFFCGGLALKALAGIVVGPLIPIGGTSFMLGWLAAAVLPFDKYRS